MAELRQMRTGDKALLVSFLRTKLGKEFDVAYRLSTRFRTKPTNASYYTCFGQYDLIEFSMVDSYKEAMNNVPFDEDIIDFEFQLFYSWDDVSHPISDFVKGFPALVLVLLKIQPSLEEKLGFNIESNAINYIKKTLIDNVNLFAGMGRSEILLLLRGKNFEKLSSNISDLRQNLTLAKIAGGLDITPFDPSSPVFIDSTTFPLIAHPALLGKKEFGEFEGQVLPRVNVICHPGYEKVVSENKPPSCATARNIYGNYDVILTWDKPIDLSQFAKELTEFRKMISAKEGIKSTVSSFIGTEVQTAEKSLHEACIYKGEAVPESIPGTEEMIEKSKIMDSMGRAQLLEFLGRLNSYYRQQEFKASFRDMTGLHYLISGPLDDLKNAPDLAHSLNTHLSEVIDLSNNALYQRYAGLETHFEVCKHLPFPFLRGINSYITAASCIPYHIFKAFFPDATVQESWSGFVIFGLSYSYQLLRGKILSYPAGFLHRPIEEWWGITHEVAHAIYWRSNFFKRDLPQDIRDYFMTIKGSDETLLFMLYVDIEEIYSNWFDFKYIFEGNQARYFPIIWKSWLRWDRVKRFKEEYLLRSLIIFLTTDLKGFFEARNTGVPQTEEYLKSKFEEMKKLIISRVQDFDEFTKDVSPQWIKRVTRFADKIEPYLNFLENRYFDREIYERINPSYPEDLLNKHVKSLEDGLIVSDNIPNPIKLLHSLYDRYPAATREVPLRTTAATVLTLWYKFIRDFGD